MSTLGWVSAGFAGAALLFVGSIVRVVPPEQPAPRTVMIENVPTPAPKAARQVLPTPAAPPPPVTLAEHTLLTVPVQGVQRSQIVDTWGDSRGNGMRTHTATDIMAPGGTPVIAAAPGTVEKLYYSNGGGGISLYVRSADRRWIYYYAHLQAYAPGIHEGQIVASGELLGFVGDTGNAGIGNFHLHFGMSRMQPGERWYQGEPVNPYPLLAGTAPPG